MNALIELLQEARVAVDYLGVHALSAGLRATGERPTAGRSTTNDGKSTSPNEMALRFDRSRSLETGSDGP